MNTKEKLAIQNVIDILTRTLASSVDENFPIKAGQIWHYHADGVNSQRLTVKDVISTVNNNGVSTRVVMSDGSGMVIDANGNPDPQWWTLLGVATPTPKAKGMWEDHTIDTPADAYADGELTIEQLKNATDAEFREVVDLALDDIDVHTNEIDNLKREFVDFRRDWADAAVSAQDLADRDARLAELEKRFDRLEVSIATRLHSFSENELGRATRLNKLEHVVAELALKLHAADDKHKVLLDGFAKAVAGAALRV